MNKEQIYDEQINPLMAQIIDICKENKIAMIASFSVPADEDDDLCVVTALCSDDYAPPEDFVTAYDVLKPKMMTISPMMLTFKDGNGNITGMEAIIGGDS